MPLLDLTGLASSILYRLVRFDEFSELVMLFEIANLNQLIPFLVLQNAYEAPKDFTIFFSNFFVKLSGAP